MSKFVKERRLKRHPLGWTYRVNNYGRWNYHYYPFKRDALAHARIMQKTHGGEWIVNRVFPSMRVQFVKSFGGGFTDWPGDGDW